MARTIRARLAGWVAPRCRVEPPCADEVAPLLTGQAPSLGVTTARPVLVDLVHPHTRRPREECAARKGEGLSGGLKGSANALLSAREPPSAADRSGLSAACLPQAIRQPTVPLHCAAVERRTRVAPSLSAVKVVAALLS